MGTPCGQAVALESVDDFTGGADRHRESRTQLMHASRSVVTLEYSQCLQRAEAYLSLVGEMSLERIPQAGLKTDELIEEVHVIGNSSPRLHIPGNIVPRHLVVGHMQPIPAPSVQFEHLRVRYGETEVLHDVSLTVEGGSFTVLLGPSGSGKTTLLRTVNRMVELAGGRVLLGGHDIARENVVSLRRSIGYVMQSSGLFPHRTVLENVATVPRLLGVSPEDAREIAFATLDRVGLGRDLARRYPAQLSGGQQQRVGVARALAAGPRLLLMDEPFGALDPITRRVLQKEILRLHAETGATVLFVTHDVDEALALGDRIVVLDAGGRVAQDAAPTEILTNPADEFVAAMLGTASGDRSLRLQDVGEVEVVVDRSGRPIGVLER